MELKMSNIFETFILPISGVDFVKYMAYFSLLSEYDLKPKIIFSASGGTFVSYMAMMSDFSKSIESWKISSEMFIHRASPISSATKFLTFVINGYFYRRANITEYVSKLFVPAKLQDVEIITGFFEMNNCNNLPFPKQRICISTNMEKDKSFIKDFISTIDMIDIEFAKPKILLISSNNHLEKINYLSELMIKTIRTIQYTTNIPIISEPLDKNGAIDFGIIAPNPRLLLNAKSLRTIYFSPINIEQNCQSNLYNTIYYNFILNDIRSITNNFTQSKTFKILQDIIDFIGNDIGCCLIIYSINEITINIENFSCEEVFYHMNISKQSLRFKLYF
jgi:hypothetical protein